MIVIVVLTGLCFLFRGWLYRHLVKYQSIGLRANYLAHTHNLIVYIDTNTGHEPRLDIKAVIKIALSLTSKQLNFTTGNNANDPNILIDTKTANCIGYAAFCATTCNCLFKKYELFDWEAKPQIGQLYLMGTNVHQFFSSPFFKDHDFVLIVNKTTGETLAVDPTLNDYLYIDFVAIK